MFGRRGTNTRRQVFPHTSQRACDYVAQLQRQLPSLYTHQLSEEGPFALQWCSVCILTLLHAACRLPPPRLQPSPFAQGQGLPRMPPSR